MHLLEYGIPLLFPTVFYVNGSTSNYCAVLYNFYFLMGPKKKMSYEEVQNKDFIV